MKQISINIRRRVKHKDFSSVLPIKKKIWPVKTENCRFCNLNRARSVIEVPRPITIFVYGKTRNIFFERAWTSILELL